MQVSKCMMKETNKQGETFGYNKIYRKQETGTLLCEEGRAELDAMVDEGHLTLCYTLRRGQGWTRYARVHGACTRTSALVHGCFSPAPTLSRPRLQSSPFLEYWARVALSCTTLRAHLCSRIYTCMQEQLHPLRLLAQLMA